VIVVVAAGCGGCETRIGMMRDRWRMGPVGRHCCWHVVCLHAAGGRSFDRSLRRIYHFLTGHWSAGCRDAKNVAVGDGISISPVLKVSQWPRMVLLPCVQDL
jgi:hypothetical protein